MNGADPSTLIFAKFTPKKINFQAKIAQQFVSTQFAGARFEATFERWHAQYEHEAERAFARLHNSVMVAVALKSLRIYKF